jgi:hypothetical protein
MPRARKKPRDFLSSCEYPIELRCSNRAQSIALLEVLDQKYPAVRWNAGERPTGYSPSSGYHGRVYIHMYADLKEDGHDETSVKITCGSSGASEAKMFLTPMELLNLWGLTYNQG